MALLPAFGEMMIPVRVRLAVTLAFTAIVAPAAFPVILAALLDGTTFAVIASAEILVGLVLGLALRFMVMALQTAGTIAAQSTSLSQLLGGTIIDPQPAIGFVFVLAGLALATLLGLHVKIAAMFIMSYDLVQPGVGLPASDLSQWGVAIAAGAFRLAFLLAAPFVIASLVYNLALGVINRAMPQLMVAFVGAPAITFGALLLLALAAPLILTVWTQALDVRLTDPFGLP